MANHTRRSSPGEVQLRNVTAEDLPIFFDDQRDPEATRMAAFPARDRDAFMAHWTKILGEETVITRTILVAGRVAGNIVSFEQDGEREVGYWIGRAYWGQGVATKALAAFLDHVRTRPLSAHVAKHNIASLRVLEKCGFTIAGEDTTAAEAPGEVIEEFKLMLESNTNARGAAR